MLIESFACFLSFIQFRQEISREARLFAWELKVGEDHWPALDT